MRKHWISHMKAGVNPIIAITKVQIFEPQILICNAIARMVIKKNSIANNI